LSEYYPRLSKVIGRKFTAYVALARPFTLVPPFLVGLVLTIAAHGLAYEAFVRGVYIGLTLALAQGCGQIVNQVVDRDLDKVVKPYRPLPRGLVSVDEATGLAWLFAIAAVGRAFTISTYFGLMVCLLLFFAAFYSLPPLSPRRRNPWLSLMWMAFSRGFLPIIAVMGLEGLPYALFSFVWAFGWQGTKDIPDVEGDREFGIRTIANTYGIEVLQGLSLASTVACSIIATVFGKPLLLLVVPLAVYGLIMYTRPWRGENTVAWAVFYLGLGMIPLLIFVERLAGFC
jgi:4-hydroxybenzoate polyprenyltransferase